MSTQDNGGRAFPLFCGPGDTENTGGMSLRDYFAAKAMTECMTASADHTDFGSPMSEVLQRAAAFSYAYADAMLKAREQ